MLARTPAALKKRRYYRKRLRDGVIVLPIEVPEADLVEALLLAPGRLDERQALNRSELKRAVEGVVSEWIARWRHKP